MMRRMGPVALWALAAGAWAPSVAWAGVKASSELTDEEGVRHSAELAFDGQLLTAWAEGAVGAGEGEWLELTLDQPMNVSSISIWAGDLRKGTRSMKEFGTPKLVMVQLDPRDGEPVESEARIGDPDVRGVHRIDVPIEGLSRTVRVRIDQVNPGFLRNDTYIAEIAVNFRSGQQPAGGAEKLEAYVASTKAVKEAEQHRDKVVTLFDAVDQSEFGDRDSLRALMDLAADGAPWLAAQVKKLIPPGFRVQALPPDDVAVQALLKLQDANGIPALTMAATRLRGREERALVSKVTYFEAFTELKGGPRRSLSDYGVPGWEVGALQGFGEPLAIGQGVYGDLYVADVANHRVAVFKPNGGSRTTWGAGAAGVTDVWFGGDRAHYVAGNEPGKKAGEYHLPVSIKVLPQGEGDAVWVLDGSGHVQRLNDKGEVQADWRVKFEAELVPRVGGQAHLLLAKGKVVVQWGDEVAVLDEAGEELARWEIEEGVPVSAVALRNGKLLFGFPSGGVQYDLDGFRQGVVMAAELLPRGAESWDMQLDEKGKLWVVTDNGVVVKYKSPSKVDFELRWTDLPTDPPRFTVREDLLHITSRGHIHVFDALEKLEAAAEAE